MLRNADSAKENEDPYPGKMSLIERCNGQSAFGSLQDCCKRQKPLFPRGNSLASAKKYFSLVATMLQAFPKALWPSCGFRRKSLLNLFLHRTHVTKGLMRSRWDFLRLDRRRTGGAKRLHTITWIRFIPNRPLEHLSIKHYDLGSGGLL